MAAIKDLLTAADIDANNETEAAAAIELASDYLNRDDFEAVPSPVTVGVKRLCASLVRGDFGSREVKSKKAGSVSYTYSDTLSSRLPREAINYLSPYRYTPGL